MPDLLDASVWVPLCVPGHVHHTRARKYWDEEAEDELLFCRVTALALLRMLTNAHIVGKGALSGAQAWQTLQAWLAVPGIRFSSEPIGMDEWLDRWVHELDIRCSSWTDAYLAAFSAASSSRLVTFDSDFCRYPGIQLLHLQD